MVDDYMTFLKQKSQMEEVFFYLHKINTEKRKEIRRRHRIHDFIECS